MRLLITGINGFVGSHLAEHVLAVAPDAEVFGLRIWGTPVADLAAVIDRVRLIDGDLLDAPSLRRAVALARPDVVIHLAAASSVAGSWEAPTAIMQANVIGSLLLLEAVRDADRDATVVVACSAEAYGRVDEADLPITEECPFRPLSPYAVSKAAVDLLCYQVHASHGLRTVRLRMFNNCGPRQTEHFVVAGLAKQVAEIEAGLRPPRIAVGNLAVSRDFIDVRDAARAFLLAAGHCEAGQAYNVASGSTHTIEEVVGRMLEMTPASIEVVVDPARLRPADVMTLQGDATRFREATGWAPSIPFETSLHDTLEHWRARVRSG